MLQLQDFRVSQVKKSYIRVNIRELDKELYTGVRCSLHLKMKVHGVGLDMHRV